MGRAPCCDKNGLKKGPWTPEEDLKLIHYIHKYGHGNWRTVPVNAGLERCGKSCRLRWTNYLRPDIKRGRFSFEEEETIIQLHSLLGNKWSAIAARLPGRTDNEIKNYWNTHIRRRLLRMGIDPVTHTRRLDLLDLPSIISSSSNLLSQLDFSNFLGIQNLANPDLLNLVSTLLSSKNENLEYLLQNLEGNQIHNAQMGNQIPPFQPHPAHDFPPYTNWQFHSNSHENSFSSNFNQSFVSQLPENATFQSLSNNDNQNLGFDSVISTPLSSPTQLNSTTTFRNGNSTTEDEKETYSSSMLKFEHFELDISDFM